MLKKEYISHSHCKNCGKNHLTNECNDLRISAGVIAYRYNNDNNIEYLLICRRDTFGFVEFIRGNYTLNNIEYIQALIDEMTITEKEKLLNLEFDNIWKLMWTSVNGLNNRCERKMSKKKYNELLNGIGTNNITLKDLIDKSTTIWTEPEWGFPKGRRNKYENDYNCALREFEEETGYSKENINIIDNIIPYEEIFTGSNFKSYKHRYYVAYVNSDATSEIPYQNSEVSCVEWKTYSDAIKCIRSYNLEKIKVLQLVNNVINKYSLYH